MKSYSIIQTWLPWVTISIGDEERSTIGHNCHWSRFAVMQVIIARFKLKRRRESFNAYSSHQKSSFSFLKLQWCYLGLQMRTNISKKASKSLLVFQERYLVAFPFLRTVGTGRLGALPHQLPKRCFQHRLLPVINQMTWNKICILHSPF